MNLNTAYAFKINKKILKANFFYLTSSLSPMDFAFKAFEEKRAVYHLLLVNNISDIYFICTTIWHIKQKMLRRLIAC